MQPSKVVTDCVLRKDEQRRAIFLDELRNRDSFDFKDIGRVPLQEFP